MLSTMLGTPIRDRRAERRQATKAEILEAAWDIVREEGVGGLNLRDLAQRLGMRAPSLYEYFPSKHAIYDAMFAEGYRQFDAIVAELVGLSGQDGLRAAARRTVDFMVDEPARFSLLFQRTIPGFIPSPESYEVSIEALERVRVWFAENGIGDSAALDLFTAVTTGLASQQIANDPGGDRWVRLVDSAVDMFLTHIQTTSGRTARRTRERTK
jgi:AcrR family transcriptional regulator